MISLMIETITVPKAKRMVRMIEMISKAVMSLTSFAYVVISNGGILSQVLSVVRIPQLIQNFNVNIME